MILGEIDLSIGAMYLFAPFLFYKFATAGIPLVPSLIIGLIVCMAVGLANGFFVAVGGTKPVGSPPRAPLHLLGPAPCVFPRAPRGAPRAAPSAPPRAGLP